MHKILSLLLLLLLGKEARAVPLELLLLLLPVARVSLLPAPCLTACVKFWMYMSKSVGELRDPIMAVML
jgi:hypothetical protein